MHIYEWLTIAAILAGPIVAISIQLIFERRREARHRKLRVLDTLMANRGRIATVEPVKALNVIDIVFYDNQQVRAKWAELFAGLEQLRQLTGDERRLCAARTDDVLTELLSLMASSLGYSIPHTALKGRKYMPQAFADEEAYTAAVRGALLPVLNSERPLRVRLDGDGPSQP